MDASDVVTRLPTKAAAGQADQPYLLATAFADIAHALYGATSVADLLERIVRVSVEIIEPCDAAAISVRGKGRAISHAGSDPVAARVEELQHELREGPSVEAMTSLEQVYADDLTASARFARLATELAPLGAGLASVVSFGLHVHHEGDGAPLGSLSLFSRTPAAFDEDNRAIGAVLSSHVSVVLAAKLAEQAGRDIEEQLQQAVSSRDVIGQAKGILMERQRLTADGAFEVLRKASQHLNIKLRDIAELFVETGDVSVLEPGAGPVAGSTAAD